MTLIVAAAFCSLPGIVTDADCLQAASDAALAASGPVDFDWRAAPTDGVWDLDRTVTIHGHGMTVHPGPVRLTAAMDVGLIIRAKDAHFTAPIRVTGTGSAVYAQRTVTDLVHLANVSYTTFSGFDLANAKRDCLRAKAPGTTTLSVISAQFGLVKARDCGASAIPTNVSRHDIEWTSVTNTGGAASVAQRAHFAVASGDAADLRTGDLVYVEGAPHYVYAVGLTEVTTFPHYAGTSASGTIESAHGAGVRITGGNSTAHRGSVDCQRVGVCLVSGGLYGGDWEMVVEASGFGVQLGQSPESAHLRGRISGHFELPDSRLSGVKVQRSALGGLLVNSLLRAPTNTCKWAGLTPKASNAYRALTGATFMHSGSAIDGDLVWCAGGM